MVFELTTCFVDNHNNLFSLSQILLKYVQEKMYMITLLHIHFYRLTYNTIFLYSYLLLKNSSFLVLKILFSDEFS